MSPVALNGAGVDAWQAAREALAANPLLALPAASLSAETIDVVVPVYNAVDDLARCVESVGRHTRHPFRLVLIDDGSSDARVESFLAAIRGAASRLVVVKRRDNKGFVRTVNEGFALAGGRDVVLLNSDTVVTAGWLGKLAAASRARPNVATVTPLTNNGTICSVPEVLIDNPVPDGYEIDEFAALVERTSFRLLPEVPTGVGFCMLIARRALAAVGAFDAAAFGRGYGEENDFCQRAIRAGFVNLVADDTFVYHRGRASFGTGGDALIARNLETVAAKHPRYHADIARFCERHPLRPFHAHLKGVIAAERTRQKAIRTRVLQVVHRGGGTEKHAHELAAIEDPGVLSYVALSDGHTLAVEELYRGRSIRWLRFPLSASIGQYGPLRSAAYRDAFAALAWTLGPDVIHVHHLMFNAVDIADVAASLRIPYVMTLHDYHTVCPMYTLLDPEGEPCGACTGASAGSIDACMTHVGQQASYLAWYQEEMRRFLGGAARLFAPSARARAIVASRFPALAGSIDVVEHGHAGVVDDNAESAQSAALAYDGKTRLRVALIGNLDPHKGARVFRDLLRANRSRSIVFHLYGTTSDPDILRLPRGKMRRLDGSRFVYHGPYVARDIVRLLKADGIHVGLQLAVWEETFSYTLSEFVEAGIPVIAGRLGAPGERIARCRLGWIVDDVRDPRTTLAILDDLVRRPESLREVASAMRRAEALRPIDDMWRDYLNVYRSLGADRSGAAAPPPDLAPDTAYLSVLATRLAESPDAYGLHLLQHEIATLHARLRSPRHRIADAIGNAIQKTPIVWPIVRAITEAVMRWRRSS